MAFNFRHPYFKDAKLRQAMNWVIDRKALADKVYFGLAVPMYSDVAPSSDKYDDKVVEKYGYDPAKAKQILKDAGYTIKDGKLLDPSGNPLPKLKYTFSTDDPIGAKIAAIAQQEWKDLGIELDLIGVNFNTLLKNITSEPFDWDIAQLGWSAGINPEGFGDVWKTIPNLNFGAWVNDDVNKLYASTLREFDNGKRKEIMSQIQSIESRDGPYIYLTAQTSYAAINKRIGGITPTPLGIGFDSRAYSYMTDWYIK
jgi:peptide/nickel transport system substrate-binding protein